MSDSSISPQDPAARLKNALIANLRDARWRTGERLPTERELCALHDVGRGTVRRVLGEMKKRGLIVQTVGSGTYVAPDAAAHLPVEPDAAASISPADLMEARIAFEPGLVDLIVRHGTMADFNEMETCCRAAEDAATLALFEHWDNAFHRSLATATHNAFLISICELVSRVREHGEWGFLKRRSLTPERRLVYQREHRALFVALRDRDADAGRKAILQHLLTVRQNMFGI